MKEMYIFLPTPANTVCDGEWRLVITILPYLVIFDCFRCIFRPISAIYIDIHYTYISAHFKPIETTLSIIDHHIPSSRINKHAPAHTKTPKPAQTGTDTHRHNSTKFELIHANSNWFTLNLNSWTQKTVKNRKNIGIFKGFQNGLSYLPWIDDKESRAYNMWSSISSRLHTDWITNVSRFSITIFRYFWIFYILY